MNIEDYDFNPTTGRLCKKSAYTYRKATRDLSNKVINPLTDRYIATGTKLHRKLIIDGHLPCPDDYVINPNTRHFVKKNSKCYKRLVRDGIISY